MFGQVILTLSLTPSVYYPYKSPKNPSKPITVLLKKSLESLAKKNGSLFLAQVQSEKLYYPNLNLNPNPNPFSTTTLSPSFCSYHHHHYCSSSQAMACSTHSIPSHPIFSSPPPPHYPSLKTPHPPRYSLKKLTNVFPICSPGLTSSLFHQRSRWPSTPYARACFLPLMKNALSCS